MTKGIAGPDSLLSQRQQISTAIQTSAEKLIYESPGRDWVSMDVSLRQQSALSGIRDEESPNEKEDLPKSKAGGPSMSPPPRLTARAAGVQDGPVAYSIVTFLAKLRG